MAHSAYRRLVKLGDTDRHEVLVPAGSGKVRASTSGQTFDGIQYEPGSVVVVVAVEEFTPGDLVEWPFGSERYHRVHASVPLPPFGVLFETVAVLSDSIPQLVYRVLIAGDDVLLAGDGVRF